MENPSGASVRWQSAAVLAGSLAVDTGLAVLAGGGSHPVADWVWPLGVLLLFVGLMSLVPGLRKLAVRAPGPTRSALVALCVAVFFAKWWWTGGLTPVLVPAAFTLGIILVVGAELRGGTNPTSWRIWWYLLVGLLVVSTRPFRTLHRLDGMASPARLGLLVLLAAVPALWLLGAKLSDTIVPEGVRAGPGLAGVALFLLVVAGAGWWLRGEVPPGAPAFRGELPTLRAERSADRLPNIILISLDTLQRDPVPPFGKRDLSLPSLRGLFRDSIAFTHMVSTSSWTLPAHASLLTGKIPLDHGAVIERNSRIFADVPLYSHVLRRLGYVNVGFTDGVLVGREFGFARGFDRYWEHPVPVDRYLPGPVEWASLVLSPTPWGFDVQWRNRTMGTRHDLPYAHDFRVNLNRSSRWIKRHAADGENPFFLFLHTYEIHDWAHYFPSSLRRLRRRHPRLHRALRRSDKPKKERTEPGEAAALERLRARSRVLSSTDQEALRTRIDLFDDTRSRAIRAELGRVHPAFFRRFLNMSREELHRLTTLPLREIRNLDQINPSRLRAQRKLYDYGIEHVDRSLGEFIRFLKDRNLYRDSIVILTSDHGEGFLLESGAMGHGRGQLDEILLRVPTWIKLPGHEHAGTRYDDLVQFTDVFPMLLEYLGVRPDPPLARDPATPRGILADPSAPGRSSAVGSIKSRRGPRPRFFVRSRHYKHTRDFGKNLTRYYRVGDRRVDQRRIPRSDLPDTAQKLLDRRMNDLVNRFHDGPDPYRTDNFTLDDTLRRRLRGMGYLD